MRRIAVSLFAFIAVTGCATVSMVPGETIVEASVTQEQSNLRDVCSAYNDQARAAKWVGSSNGLMDFAKVLMDGVTQNETAPRTYSDVIEVETAPVAELFHRIAADAGAARVGLEVVTNEAFAFIEVADPNASSLRKDVMSFESVLVTAQKSRRSFATAISVVAERGDQGLMAADLELTALDLAIDRARDAANQLAKVHANMPSGTSVS